MAETLDTVFNFLAFWGVPIFSALLLGSVVGVFLLARGWRRRLRPRWKSVVGLVLLLPLVAFSGFALYAFTGPLDSFLDGLRRFHHVAGKEVPDLELRRVSDDAEISLHQIRGQVTLVNLWATWCPPCIQEMPELDRLQKTYRDRGLVVVTLSQEERQRLLDFAAEHRYSMTNVYAEEIGWLDIGENNRPLTVVLDHQGVLRDFTVGARDYAGFERMVRPYLAGDQSL